MEEQNINPEQSMQIIQSMINRAQSNVSDNGFYFIFWGWLVFLCSVIFYITLKMEMQYGWLVWSLMPLGGIFTGIYSYYEHRKYNPDAQKKVKTYAEVYLGYLWIAFGISLCTILFMMGKLGESTYPLVINLYAIGTFVSGGILRFKPLIIGGAFSFAIAIVSFFTPFENQVLLVALSLLVSYIIPGHLLRNKFKNQ